MASPLYLIDPKFLIFKSQIWDNWTAQNFLEQIYETKNPLLGGFGWGKLEIWQGLELDSV